MTTTGFRIDGRTTAPIRRKIQAMRRRAENLTPAWDALADWFGDQNRLQWGSRGARWRTLWPELAPTTVKQKRYEGWTGDILRRSRHLERSLTDRPLSIELIEPHAMSLGTRVHYAKYHQHGTRKMPRRTLFDVRRIAAEGVVGQAVVSWVIRGRVEIRERR